MSVLLVVISTALCLVAGDQLVASKPFSVTQNTDEHNTVVAQMETSATLGVRCTLSYTALSGMRSSLPGPSAEASKAQELLRQLGGQCILGKSQEGYWSFEVCIGRDITQYHDNERYVLGRYASNLGLTTQGYENGAPCDGGKSRRAEVNFACGPQTAVADVHEPEMCVYEVTVTHTSLCASQVFPHVRSDITAAQRNTEDWFMELSEDIDGRVGCIAHSLAEHSALTFLRFTMQLHKQQASSWEPIPLAEPVVRGVQRRRLHTAELIQAPGESFGVGVVNSSSMFSGSLESIEAWSLEAPSKNPL